MARTFRDDLEEELKDPESAKMFGAAQAKSSFALTLAKARAKLGLTQKELASKIGVSQAYIAKLEGGEANPTLERIGSLLAVLELSLTTATTTLSPYPETLLWETEPVLPPTRVPLIPYATEGRGSSRIERESLTIK